MPAPISNLNSKSALTTRLWYFIFISIVLLWYFRQANLYSVLGLDASVFLACAQQLLDGQKMFLDIFEINFPLISYISIIPMLLSNVTGWDIAYAFVIFVVTVAAISLTLSTLVLRHAGEDERYIGYAMLAACVIQFVFSAQFIFGQREQLFVLLYLPFFYTRWLRSIDRAVGLPLAVCVGILAGIGCSIKPYFAVIALCIELAFFLQYRRIASLKAAEVVACLSTAFVYLAHFLFWDPAALRFFTTEHIPSVISSYHCADCTLSSALLVTKSRYTLSAMLVSAVWAAFFFRREKLIPVLLTWIGSAYFMFLIQMKGWAYQAVPISAGLSLTLAALFVLTLRSFFQDRTDGIASAENTDAISNTKSINQFSSVYSTLQCILLAALVLKLAAVSFFAPEVKPKQSPDLVQFSQLFSQYTVPGDSVAVIGLDGRLLQPELLHHRLRLGWRYAWGYPMHFLIYEMKTSDKHDVNEGARFEKAWDKVLRTASDDVRTRKPKVVMIDAFVKDKMGKLGLLDETVSNYRPLDTITYKADPARHGIYSVYVLRDLGQRK